MSKNTLSLAECVIYAILALPVLFLTLRHRRHGLMGWLYLFVFCGIRIVGGGLSVNSSSSAAIIISSVGISPLLFASAGILREARILRIPSTNKKLESVPMAIYHIVVIAGVALTAAGSAKLEKQGQTTDAIDKAKKMVKVGIAILTIAWLMVVAYAGLTFVGPRPTSNRLARAGTTLLNAVAFSLVFIGIRVIYALVYMTTENASLSPITGSLAVRVVLSLLPELIATLAYILAGVKTMPEAALDHGEVEDSRKPPAAQPWV